MKTSSPIVVLPVARRPARVPAQPAGALAKVPALPILWRVFALVAAIALAQLAFRALRSSGTPGPSAGPPMATGLAPARAAAPSSYEGFRDEARCDVGGEPIECR